MNEALPLGRLRPCASHHSLYPVNVGPFANGRNRNSEASTERISSLVPSALVSHRLVKVTGPQAVFPTYREQLPFCPRRAMGATMKSHCKQICDVRWMIRRDMEEVFAIEDQSFEYPWSEEEFIFGLRRRNVIGKVAVFQEKVVGFMIYELFRTRLRLIDIAVHEANRHCGIGTALLRNLIGKLSPFRRRRILLEVRETNLTAQIFFRAMGFRAEATLRGYYEDTTEDAYRMVYRQPGLVELRINPSVFRASLPAIRTA
jgi:ribosomal-protein-alanine N-acetyltransferase